MSTKTEALVSAAMSTLNHLGRMVGNSEHENSRIRAALTAAFSKCALLTAPAEPAPIQASALTDDQIMDIAEPFHDINGVLFDEVAFARALLASGAPAQGILGKLMDEMSQLPHLFPDGCQEPGALLRQSDVQRVLVDASKFAARLSKPTAQGTAESIDSIADELEQEAMNYEGDFADTVRGCAEALRHIATYAHAPAGRDAIRNAWEKAAQAVGERAAGHYRAGNYELQDECLQCASMLRDMKPAASHGAVEGEQK